MKRNSLRLLVLAIATSTATGALAAGNHGSAPGKALMQQGGPMQGRVSGAGHGDMAGMMDMMMQMHSQMMGSSMMGNVSGQQMMDGPIMGNRSMPMVPGQRPGMMFGMGEAFDSDQDGRLSPSELRAGLTERLEEYDADNDGTLSLAEFEALHSATIREMMVDRFQFFDRDGDGSVTEPEMHAPANRMSMITQRQTQPGTGMNDDMMDDQSGSMMNDN